LTLFGVLLFFRLLGLESLELANHDSILVGDLFGQLRGVAGRAMLECRHCSNLTDLFVVVAIAAT
jgi:hypothetical protein